MTLFLLLSALAASWFLVCFVSHGYSNTIDQIAYILHKHAKSMRKLHERRTAAVRERWVREIEGGGEIARHTPDLVIDRLSEVGHTIVQRQLDNYPKHRDFTARIVSEERELAQ